MNGQNRRNRVCGMTSVSHGIHDEIDALPIREGCQTDRIFWIVLPFPGIAKIGIVGHDDHDAMAIVVDTQDSRFPVVRLFPRPGIGITSENSARIADVGNLGDMVDVKESMKDFVIQRNVLGISIGKNFVELLNDVSQLAAAPEIIEVPEASPQQVFP